MIARDHLVDALCRDPSIATLWHAGFRARIGVSACLAGEAVRYDGDHRRSPLVAGVLPLVAAVVPLCPEHAIGLGVPRPPLRCVRLADGRIAVRGVADPSRDVTALLESHAVEVQGGGRFHGYVFKARSPSCAPGNAPLHDESGAVVGNTAGRYAAVLRRDLPGAPMCDEEALATMGQLAAFVIACYRHAAAVTR